MLSKSWPQLSAHGRRSRSARQACWRVDFQREADDPHDVFRVILTHNRSPFRVQPLHAAIIVHDAELDRRMPRAIGPKRLHRSTAEGASVVGMHALQEQMKLRRHIVANS